MKTTAILFILLLILGGCLNEPPSKEILSIEKNVSTVLNISSDWENKTVHIQNKNESLLPENLTVMNYSYVVPVNRTTSLFIYDGINETNHFQDIKINNIGNTNLSFYLHFDDVIGQHFFLAGSGGHYTEYGGPGPIIDTFYFRIVYDIIGKPRTINSSHGDMILLKNGSEEIFFPGKELKDWNVKLTILSLKKEYQINFTILEPIPLIDE